MASDLAIEDVHGASLGRGRIAIPRLPDGHRCFVRGSLLEMTGGRRELNGMARRLARAFEAARARERQRLKVREAVFAVRRSTHADESSQLWRQRDMHFGSQQIG